VGRERGEERKIKERDRVVSLFFLQRYGSLYLSATNGYRVPETVIKVERKPAKRLKHIRRYSMPGMEMRQGEVLRIRSFFF
jgi:hypothetical protein